MPRPPLPIGNLLPIMWLVSSSVASRGKKLQKPKLWLVGKQSKEANEHFLSWSQISNQQKRYQKRLVLLSQSLPSETLQLVRLLKHQSYLQRKINIFIHATTVTLITMIIFILTCSAGFRHSKQKIITNNPESSYFFSILAKDPIKVMFTANKTTNEFHKLKINNQCHRGCKRSWHSFGLITTFSTLHYIFPNCRELCSKCFLLSFLFDCVVAGGKGKVFFSLFCFSFSQKRFPETIWKMFSSKVNFKILNSLFYFLHPNAWLACKTKKWWTIPLIRVLSGRHHFN